MEYMTFQITNSIKYWQNSCECENADWDVFSGDELASMHKAQGARGVGSGGDIKRINMKPSAYKLSTASCDFFSYFCFYCLEF